MQFVDPESKGRPAPSPATLITSVATYCHLGNCVISITRPVTAAPAINARKRNGRKTFYSHLLSHDINKPLTVLATRKLCRETNAAQSGVAMVQTSTSTINRLLHCIFTVAKNNRPRMEIFA